MQTPCMTMYILMCLKDMAKESKSLKILKKIASFIKNQFLHSLLYGFLSCIAGFFKASYDASFLKKYITSEGFVQKAYSESLICSLINGAYKIASALLGNILKLIFKIFNGSLTQGVFIKLSKKMIFSFSSCLSIFICLMIICPHEAWNNLYGVLAAFGFIAYFMARGYVKSQMADFKKESFYQASYIAV